MTLTDHERRILIDALMVAKRKTAERDLRIEAMELHRALSDYLAAYAKQERKEEAVAAPF